MHVLSYYHPQCRRYRSSFVIPPEDYGTAATTATTTEVEEQEIGACNLPAHLPLRLHVRLNEQRQHAVVYP